MSLNVAPLPEKLPAPRPFWFGPAARPLFGWYHGPRPSSSEATAVLLCNPFGYEAMSAHRAYRHLARRLANAGHPVLRFDYDGTGDSAGEATDPDRVAAWLGSIDEAARELARLSGCARLVLVGLRFGALLAAAHAVAHPVDGLVLIGPPPSGRAWVREMNAMQTLRRLPPRADGKPPPPEEAVVGFPMDAATRTALSGIDLRSLSSRPARRILVIARDDLPGGEEALVKRFSELGAEAALAREPGYAGMVPDDPVRTNVPEKMFEAIETWLADDKDSKGVTSFVPSASSMSSAESVSVSPRPGVREEAVFVGDLFGIVSEPEQPERCLPTAVVLLNTGANHHIGSNRMYVTMARSWAERGFRVLRLDFSGIGDSLARPGGKENDIYSRVSFEEARAALDFLGRRGATRFVLAGLCSGSYVAYHTAVADPRVSGVVLMNTATFHWKEGDSLEIKLRAPGASTRFYKRAIFWPKTWSRLLRGDIDVKAISREMLVRAKARARREANMWLAQLRNEEVETSDVGRGFRKLVSRGVRCLLVFGAFELGIDVVEAHLGPGARSMRGEPGFRMELVDGVDHTFTPLWSQRHLLRMVTDHLVSTFGAPT